MTKNERKPGFGFELYLEFLTLVLIVSTSLVAVAGGSVSRMRNESSNWYVSSVDSWSHYQAKSIKDKIERMERKVLATNSSSPSPAPQNYKLEMGLIQQCAADKHIISNIISDAANHADDMADKLQYAMVLLGLAATFAISSRFSKRHYLLWISLVLASIGLVVLINNSLFIDKEGQDMLLNLAKATRELDKLAASEKLPNQQRYRAPSGLKIEEVWPQIHPDLAGSHPTAQDSGKHAQIYNLISAEGENPVKLAPIPERTRNDGKPSQAAPPQYSRFDVLFSCRCASEVIHANGDLEKIPDSRVRSACEKAYKPKL